MSAIGSECLKNVVGGVQDAAPYTMMIDGWRCDIGAHYQNSQIGPYGGQIEACSDMGSGGPMSDRLRKAFQAGPLSGIVPGVVDPEGLAGTKTRPPAP